MNLLILSRARDVDRMRNRVLRLSGSSKQEAYTGDELEKMYQEFKRRILELAEVDEDVKTFLCWVFMGRLAKEFIYG